MLAWWNGWKEKRNDLRNVCDIIRCIMDSGFSFSSSSSYFFFRYTILHYIIWRSEGPSSLAYEVERERVENSPHQFHLISTFFCCVFCVLFLVHSTRAFNYMTLLFVFYVGHFIFVYKFIVPKAAGFFGFWNQPSLFVNGVGFSWQGEKDENYDFSHSLALD